MQIKRLTNPSRLCLEDIKKGNEPLINKVISVITILTYTATFIEGVPIEKCMTAKHIMEHCNFHLAFWGLSVTIEEIDEILNCYDAGQIISRYDDMGDEAMYGLRIFGRDFIGAEIARQAFTHNRSTE